MTCRQLTPDLIDLARGIALDSPRDEAIATHLRSCQLCAARFNRERAMSVALRGLAGEDRVPPPSDLRLGRLLARVNPPPSSRRAALGVGLSLAAGLLLVAGLSRGWKGHESRPGVSGPVAAEPAPSVTAEPAFVVLPGATALPRFESGQIIRVEIPSPAGAIQADVLVGQDGLARAVRLVD